MPQKGKDAQVLRHNPLSTGIQGFTWAPEVCKIIAFMAISLGLGPLFYILLGLGRL